GNGVAQKLFCLLVGTCDGFERCAFRVGRVLVVEPGLRKLVSGASDHQSVGDDQPKDGILVMARLRFGELFRRDEHECDEKGDHDENSILDGRPGKFSAPKADEMEVILGSSKKPGAPFSSRSSRE